MHSQEHVEDEREGDRVELPASSESGSCDASAIVTTIRISMLYISCQPQAVLLDQPRAGKRRESHGSQTSHAELAEAPSLPIMASRPGHSSIFHQVPHKK